MTLISRTLLDAFIPFFDQEDPAFEAHPKDVQEVASLWSEAVDKYASQVTPASTTAAAAKEAFRNTMLAMNESNGATVLQQAFMAYALQLAAGMTAVGFTGTPPAAPLQLQPVFSVGLAGGSNRQCLEMLVQIIDVWFKTGVAVQVSSGVTTTWL